MKPKAAEQEGQGGIEWYQNLFNYMSEQHNLTLVQSEMNDIIQIVRKMDAQEGQGEKKARCPDCNGYGKIWGNALQETFRFCESCNGTGKVVPQGQDRIKINNMITIQTLLDLLAAHGGSIVSTASLQPEWIDQARASSRLYVDENSLGFVWEPDIKRIPETVKEVEWFEKWYPNEMPLPEHLKNPDFLFKKNPPTPSQPSGTGEEKTDKI